MKKLLALLLCIAFSAQAMWNTNGIIVNPTAGQVIADTGSINGGSSYYTFVVAANVAARFEIAVRNPANTADIVGNVQNFFVPANGNFTVVIPVDVPSNGRVVIRTPTAITGSVQASILKDGPA
jgi:hypothetical protein